MSLHGMTVGQCNRFVISFLQLVSSQQFYFNYLPQKKQHQQICSSLRWSLLSGEKYSRKYSRKSHNLKYAKFGITYLVTQFLPQTKILRENYLSVSKWFKRPGFYRTCALYTLTRMIYNLTQVGFQCDVSSVLHEF